MQYFCINSVKIQTANVHVSLCLNDKHLSAALEYLYQKASLGMEWYGILLLGLSSSLLDGEHSLASQGTSLVRGMKVLGQNPGIQTSPC